jgi:steroid 5-alpha reductase family enzyme
MSLLAIYGITALIILASMSLLWVVSLILKNSSIVDIFWGTGFMITAWISFILTPQGFLGRKILLVSLVTIWGLRLSVHVLLRNWGKGEDFRYQKWRNESSRNWWWYSYFKVFLLQGALMWVIAVPLTVAQFRSLPAHLIWLDFLAIFVWLIGFFFEAAGDWQLSRFRAESRNQGKVLRSGVWRYTRHPNYFGDATQWWAYYLIAAAAGAYWAVISPIIMTLFLLRVSGVTMLESTLRETKPGYKEYIQSTSSFIPWFPRKGPDAQDADRNQGMERR